VVKVLTFLPISRRESLIF